MASDDSYIEFSHQGIEVAIRLTEVIEIEVMTQHGKRPTLAISGHESVGRIKIGKEQCQPDLKVVKR